MGAEQLGPPCTHEVAIGGGRGNPEVKYEPGRGAKKKKGGEH